MAAKYSLRKESYEDLELALGVDEKKLAALTQTLESISPTILSASRLLELATPVVGDDAAAAALVRQLLIIAEVARDDGKPASDVLLEVIEAVRGYPDAESALVADLDGKARALAPLLASDHIKASAKAITLSFSSQSLLTGVRIINDFRPVYSDNKQSILGLITTLELCVEYSAAGQRQQLNIAIDKEDLAKLKAACDDAFQKIETSLSFARQSGGMNAIVAGEETYAFKQS